MPPRGPSPRASRGGTPSRTRGRAPVEPPPEFSGGLPDFPLRAHSRAPPHSPARARAAPTPPALNIGDTRRRLLLPRGPSASGSPADATGIATLPLRAPQQGRPPFPPETLRDPLVRNRQQHDPAPHRPQNPLPHQWRGPPSAGRRCLPRRPGFRRRDPLPAPRAPHSARRRPAPARRRPRPGPRVVRERRDDRDRDRIALSPRPRGQAPSDAVPNRSPAPGEVSRRAVLGALTGRRGGGPSPRGAPQPDAWQRLVHASRRF